MNSKIVYGLSELLASDRFKKKINLTDIADALVRISSERFDGIVRVFDTIDSAAYYAAYVSEEGTAELLAEIISRANEDSPIKIVLSYDRKSFFIRFVSENIKKIITDDVLGKIENLSKDAGFEISFDKDITLKTPLVARTLVVRAISGESFYKVLCRVLDSTNN